MRAAHCEERRLANLEWIAHALEKYRNIVLNLSEQLGIAIGVHLQVDFLSKEIFDSHEESLNFTSGSHDMQKL